MSIILSEHWKSIQGLLFTGLSDALGEALTDKHKQLAAVLEVVRVCSHVPSASRSLLGRPSHDLKCIARAFIAKSVYNLPTTECLIECLQTDVNLRILCGWQFRHDVPSSATFSRAFKGFSESDLGSIVHRHLIATYIGDTPVMHVSLDSTEVIARERAVKKVSTEIRVPRKRGRPKKGEERPTEEPKRLDIQLDQSAEGALADLPKVCNWGSKRDTGGHTHTWKGWKAHIKWGDDNIPLSVVTTSASLHDSQVAIPMTKQLAEYVLSFYDLMDSAYDAPQIRQTCADIGHTALIDPNPRRSGVPEEKLFDPAMKERYKNRTAAERGNSRLKDEFGLRFLRVRGHAKAHLHIMFGIIALFADQLLKPTVA
jgi:hypothetical protein